MLYKNHITAENMFPELHHVPKKLSANQISWFFNTIFAELLALLASFVSMLVWYLIFVPVIWRNLLCLPMRVSVSLFKISLRIGLLHFFVKQARKHQIWKCRITRRNLQFGFGGVAVKVVFVSVFRYIGRPKNIWNLDGCQVRYRGCRFSWG